MRRFFTIAAALPLGVCAQSTQRATVDSSKIDVQAVAACADAPAETRLACFDRAIAKAAAPIATVPMPGAPASTATNSGQTQTLKPVRFLIRDTGNFSIAGGYSLGTKAAQIALQQVDGKEASSAKAAALAIFPAWNALGSQAFASIGWNRDTTGTTPKDIRDLSVGVTSPFWDIQEHGWTLTGTAQLIHRSDVYGTKDGDTLGTQINYMRLNWITQPRTPGINTFLFVPYVGYLHEQRKSKLSDDGRWSSAYLGLAVDGQLDAISPRLTSNASYRRLYDQNAPGSNAKRRNRFSTLSFDYELTDPEDKSISVRPSIFLARDVGIDFLAGTSATNKTSFGFRLKVN